MSSLDILILLTTALIATTLVIPGTFMLVRKESMLADALSHAVLPGIVAGYLISGIRFGPAMLFLAIGAAWLCVFFIQVLQRQFFLATDASIGLVYSSFFSLGVLLVSAYGSQVDLDLDCILFGNVEWIVFHRESFSGMELPLQAWVAALLLLIQLIFYRICYRPLWAVSFDANAAALAGFKIEFWHQSLLFFMSTATVLAFEAVGAVLVIAWLVMPQAAARLVGTNFKSILFIAWIFAIFSVLLGYYLAFVFNASISASIVLVQPLLLLLAIFLRKILSPRLAA